MNPVKLLLPIREGIDAMKKQGQLSHSSTVENWQDFVTSFFRIIMPSVILNGAMVLPKAFTDEYGDELSSTISLVDPFGLTWHIGLKKSGCLLWLKDGLKTFMKHYSVRFAHFLLFKYRGNSEFDFHIFDATATEIGYPLGRAPKRHSETTEDGVCAKGCLGDKRVKKECKDEPISDVPFASSSVTFPKRKALTEYPIQKDPLRARKVLRTIHEPLHHPGSSANRPRLAPSHGVNRKTCSKKNGRTSSRSWVGKSPVLDQAEERALHAATMYKTDNPFCIIKLKDYHVKDKYTCCLPRGFSKGNIHGCPEFIELLDSSSNMKWSVRCKQYGNRLSLSKGWSRFVKENGLQSGDVCVFELIKPNPIVKVSVFHAKEEGSAPSPRTKV